MYTYINMGVGIWYTQLNTILPTRKQCILYYEEKMFIVSTYGLAA